ncbi:hypothetical protein K3495_g5740 [Podosphaera aphanis]|nr:hypothetical protein K3495_g5740 [Podosphaera aphanis]
MQISIFNLITTIAVIFFSVVCLVTPSSSLPTNPHPDHIRSGGPVQKRGKKLGYYCNQPKKSKRKFFKISEINDAVADACDQLGSTKLTDWPFPVDFTATTYSEPGPYFEWPILYSGPISTKKVKLQHVVIDKKCNLVDVITQYEDGHYEQCEKKWM